MNEVNHLVIPRKTRHVTFVEKVQIRQKVIILNWKGQFPSCTENYHKRLVQKIQLPSRSCARLHIEVLAFSAKKKLHRSGGSDCWQFVFTRTKRNRQILRKFDNFGKNGRFVIQCCSEKCVTSAANPEARSQRQRNLWWSAKTSSGRKHILSKLSLIFYGFVLYLYVIDWQECYALFLKLLGRIIICDRLSV